MRPRRVVGAGLLLLAAAGVVYCGLLGHYLLQHPAAVRHGPLPSGSATAAVVGLATLANDFGGGLGRAAAIVGILFTSLGVLCVGPLGLWLYRTGAAPAPPRPPTLR